MEMTIRELLFLMSSVLVLPAVAVLITAYFNGSLTATEDAKYLVFQDSEADYWALDPQTGAKAVARPTPEVPAHEESE